MSTARDRLLAQLLHTFGEDLPPRNASLREVAARAGTSHALLRYHFGSHAGMLAAMLTAHRAQDNELLARHADTLSFPELVEQIWTMYTAPHRVARSRGFFLVAGLAAQDPAAFSEFTGTLDDLQGLLVSVARRDGVSEGDASLRAAVTIAALRGLLLQTLLTPEISAEPALRLVLEIASPPGTATVEGSGGVSP